MTTELASRLLNDPVALERFYRSFGLDPGKLRTRGLSDIKELFPDTPVKMLKDVCEALQLYDLVELLDKVTKPRALRPALPLKEIEKLPRANNRPIKIFTQAEVLIINFSGEDGADCHAENFGSFFKVLNPQNQVTTLTAKSSRNLSGQLDKLMKDKMIKEYEMGEAQYCLEHEIPYPGGYIRSRRRRAFGLEKVTPESKEMTEMKKELTEKSRSLAKQIISINEKIKEKKEELKKEDEKFKVIFSTQIDKCTEQEQGRLTLINS